MSVTQKIQDVTLDQALDVYEQSEALLALTGVEDALMLDRPIKVTDALIARSYKLHKDITKQCYQFIEQPTFDKINLNLQDVNFIEMQEKMFEAKDADWITKKVQDIPQDLVSGYSVLLVRLLDQLLALVPRLPVSISSDKRRPNDFAVAKFQTAFRTINDPMTILSDLQQGCLSRGQVSTVIVAYPKLYELMKSSLIAAAVEVQNKDPEHVLPYSKLKQLSVFMLMNTVPPDLQAFLQGNFKKADEDEARQAQNDKQINFAKQAETKTQRISEK